MATTSGRVEWAVKGREGEGWSSALVHSFWGRFGFGAAKPKQEKAGGSESLGESAVATTFARPSRLSRSSILVLVLVVVLSGRLSATSRVVLLVKVSVSAY